MRRSKRNSSRKRIRTADKAGTRVTAVEFVDELESPNNGWTSSKKMMLLLPLGRDNLFGAKLSRIEVVFGGGHNEIIGGLLTRIGMLRRNTRPSIRLFI
jgi:hypothetical protein